MRRGYLIELFQKAGVFEEFLAKEWPTGKTAEGQSNIAFSLLLYYMSWIDRNLGLGNSRGVIIANEIYPELQLAVSRAPGVELAVYKMQFSIERAGAA